MIQKIACMLALALPLALAQNPADTSTASDIEQLKQMLLDQQRQINDLRHQLGLPVAAGVPRNSHEPIAEVASTTPVLPSAAAPAPATAPVFTPTPSSSSSSSTAGSGGQGGAAESPLQFKLGDAFFTPVGFMDMTSVTRSVNAGSGIGTNFGSMPYGNTQAGSLTESRLSPQNSRLGMRVDALVKDMKVMGYWESDFLGQLGNPPNGGLAVSSNPYVFRLRLYWVDVMKGKFEFLAGQSWSLMTPNRKGLSALPGDVFFSQDIDVNYQLGLVWARNPGFRFVYHPSDKVAFGMALENSEPYVGGGNGGSAIVAPAAFAGLLGSQLNNGGSQIAAPALHPDIIAKLAFDPTRKFHFEVAGIEVTDKISSPVSSPLYQTSTKVGGGGSVNANFEVAKGFRVLVNTFYSAGAGRYIFGQAPDFMVRSNGSLSLVRSASTVTGFEWTAGRNLLYMYYGGVYIPRNTALDANGKSLIGYGAISSDGQNRAIQEITFGTNTTLAKSPKWGALNLMFQYSYLQRNPWLVAAGAPSNASASMGFVNLRFTLPGSAPTMGK